MINNSNQILILFTAICIFLSGCVENSLNENELVDYSIDQKLSCFCPNSNMTVRLYVRADSISDAIDIDKGIHLPKNEWEHYKSIKGLFDMIPKLDTSIFKIEVLYDPVYHYPAYISANPKPIYVNDSIIQVIMDAGFSYSTSNYIKYK